MRDAAAIFVAADAPIGEALGATDARKDIVSVRARRRRPGDNVKAAEAGIVTERDVLRAIAAARRRRARPAGGQIMSQPLASVPADAFVYRAIGRMSRSRSAISVSSTKPAAWSARCRRATCCGCAPGRPISLGDEIDDAADAHALARAWAKLPRVADALLAEGLSGREIAAVISRELGALTRPGRRDRRAEHARARPGRTAVPLCPGGARIGRPRREPAGDGSGQCA